MDPPESQTLTHGGSKSSGSLNLNRSGFKSSLNQIFKMFVEPLCAAQLDPLIEEPEGVDFFMKILLGELSVRPNAAERIKAKANTGHTADNLLTLDQSVRLYGIQNVKFLIIAEKLAEVFPSKILERNQTTGELVTPLSQLFSFTVRALQSFGDDGPHKNVAFASGLVFDILAIVNTQEREVAKQKKWFTFLEELFSQGVVIAQAALNLGKMRKRLVLEKHIISLVMLNQASHAAMGLVNDDYLDDLQKLKKGNLSIALQNFAIQKRFYGSHCEYAPVLSLAFRIFDGLSLAFLHAETPHLLSVREEVNLFDISAISFLSQQILLNPSRFKGGGSFQAAEVRPELKKFELSFEPGNLLNKKGEGK